MQIFLCNVIFKKINIRISIFFFSPDTLTQWPLYKYVRQKVYINIGYLWLFHSSVYIVHCGNVFSYVDTVILPHSSCASKMICRGIWRKIHEPSLNLLVFMLHPLHSLAHFFLFLLSKAKSTTQYATAV